MGSKIVMSCRFDPNLHAFLRGPVLLNGDQEICPRCKGQGYHENYDTDDVYISKADQHGIFDCCWVCNGDGFVDWIRRPFIGDWEKHDKLIEECNREEDNLDAYEADLLAELDDLKTSSFDINK